jgi:hypothetical protein
MRDYTFNPKNVAIICVTVLICFGMLFGAILHESIINHQKGPWTNKVTITIDKDGKVTQE